MDADGDRIPLLDEHDEITTENMVKVEEAVYGAYDESVTYGAHRVADELRRLRDWARAQLKHVLNKLDATDAERKSAHRMMTDAGELAGLHATAEAIPHRYRASQFEIETLLPLSSRGAGGFDGAFRVTPRKGVENGEKITGPILVVVEAKGAHAELGHRRGLDDLHYQQGRREYLESVLAAMGKSADPEASAHLADMQEAFDSKKLRYELVRATVDKNGSYSGFWHREFDIQSSTDGNEAD
ncbi:hypothetical protein QNM97_06300 [Gordonia sp. L191]|uniref:hypothetical protein n=1 Tax=Gordonia sp. L191 TaxID=2982699 RepID=UPI0024BF67F9|nr:hypothetical protein [Gordonia sp. L191]WHU48606.1 hypothetical protein QNM97_06300 [Gordonia sp. L191]